MQDYLTLIIFSLLSGVAAYLLDFLLYNSPEKITTFLTRFILAVFFTSLIDAIFIKPWYENRVAIFLSIVLFATSENVLLYFTSIGKKAIIAFELIELFFNKIKKIKKNR